MNTLFLPATALVLAVALSGCGRGDRTGSAARAAAALSAAQEQHARANASIEALRDRGREMQELIVRQRATLDELIEKLLVLLRQDVDTIEQHLQDLPAERESALADSVNLLYSRLSELEQKYRAYRDAPPDRADALLADLESTLASFAQARDEMQARVQSS